MAVVHRQCNGEFVDLQNYIASSKVVLRSTKKLENVYCIVSLVAAMASWHCSFEINALEYGHQNNGTEAYQVGLVVVKTDTLERFYRCRTDDGT